MSLRARLLAGLVLVLVALVGAGVSVSLVQRDYLYGQLDEQLISGVSNFDHMTGPNGRPLLGPGFRGGRRSRIPGEVFVGFLSADGSVTAMPEMQADAALAPELASDTAIANPTTLPTRADDSKNVRVVTAKLRSGVTMVFAVSTTAADQTLRKLVVTLLIGGLAVLAVVALVVWWVIRLGLRPIRRMTEAADAIAGGAVDRRVEGTEGRTEAARLGHALNVMIDTSQASQDRLRTFVADASHELRTPLTTLRGYTALYNAGGYPDDAALDDAMRRMNQEANRMSRIVEDLLLLAELDERTGDRAADVVDLASLLRDLASDMRAVQPDRVVTVDAPSEVNVIGDAHHLTQAIAAFTTNAMRYTPIDTPVLVRANIVGKVARIEVTDEGPGIDPAHVPHLFDRFYRADVGRARRDGGNGLGLAIVASIVDEHHGRCGVQSVVGSGTTFWIELPLTTSE